MINVTEIVKHANTYIGQEVEVFGYLLGFYGDVLSQSEDDVVFEYISYLLYADAPRDEFRDFLFSESFDCRFSSVENMSLWIDAPDLFDTVLERERCNITFGGRYLFNVPMSFKGMLSRSKIEGFDFALDNIESVKIYYADRAWLKEPIEVKKSQFGRHNNNAI